MFFFLWSFCAAWNRKDDRYEISEETFAEPHYSAVSQRVLWLISSVQMIATIDLDVFFCLKPV
jgi:hypothetical protein